MARTETIAAPVTIIDCPQCEGQGELQPGTDPTVAVVCPRCAGEGEIAQRPAPPVMACCGGILSEHFEFCQLVAEITDRRGPRYVTVLGDRRERPVRCRTCGDPDVWAVHPTCDRCAIREAERTAA